VLVLGVVEPGEAVALAGADVEVVLGDEGWRGWVEPLRAGGVVLRAHVHVDSGLGREGFTPEQLASGLAGLREADDALPVVGVMTHFADTEDVTEQAYALEQLRQFNLGADEVSRLVGRQGLLRHTAASAPALVLPESRMDVIRVGISAYGLWPSRETRISARVVAGGAQRLEPVLAWRVGVQHLKELPAGSYVGYGCTWRCPYDTRVAVLPVGYYDGYPRAASGRARVLAGGRRCPVLGRVMMNHLIVDVTEAEVDADTVFTLIGRDGAEEVTADDLAGWAGTINYEIVARLGAHLPRLVVAEGEPLG
jgi:alanine racemase